MRDTQRETQAEGEAGSLQGLDKAILYLYKILYLENSKYFSFVISKY